MQISLVILLHLCFQFRLMFSPKQSRSMWFFQMFPLVWLCTFQTIYWTTKELGGRGEAPIKGRTFSICLQEPIDHIILKGIKGRNFSQDKHYWTLGASQKAFCISIIKSVLHPSPSQFSHVLHYHLLLIHFVNIDSLFT